MALFALSGDEQRILFTQLCNVLEPRYAVYLCSASTWLQEPTQALLQELRADHEAAAALCVKLGMRSCKELREARKVDCVNEGLSESDLALLGTLGSVLPALETLTICDNEGPDNGPDGVQRLAERLGAGALPAVTEFYLESVLASNAGASALVAALGRGALPRLKILVLDNANVSDAGLVALAPALRRRPALEFISLTGNPFGAEGLAALVAPPAAGAPPPHETGVLANLKSLNLGLTMVTDAGCAALAAALDSGALPALGELFLFGIPASAAAKAAVYEARANLKDGESEDGETAESGYQEDEEDEEGDADEDAQ
eukprot:scaffold91260_cov63-Phaeocystis_antarctica.AAC.1